MQLLPVSFQNFCLSQGRPQNLGLAKKYLHLFEIARYFDADAPYVPLSGAREGAVDAALALLTATQPPTYPSVATIMANLYASIEDADAALQCNNDFLVDGPTDFHRLYCVKHHKEGDANLKWPKLPGVADMDAHKRAHIQLTKLVRQWHVVAKQPDGAAWPRIGGISSRKLLRWRRHRVTGRQRLLPHGNPVVPSV